MAGSVEHCSVTAAAAALFRRQEVSGWLFWSIRSLFMLLLLLLSRIVAHRMRVIVHVASTSIV